MSVKVLMDNACAMRHYANMLPKAILRLAKDEVANHPEALVTVIDPTGKFLFISPSLQDLVGFTPEEATGRNLADFFAPAEASHFMLTIQDALLRGMSIPTTRVAPIKSGGTRRMRGKMRRLEHEATGREYVLSVAWPVG